MDKLYVAVFVWVKQQGASVDVQVTHFWLAALNEDEARGIAWRLVNKHIPDAFVPDVVKTNLMVSEAPHVPPGTVQRAEEKQ